MYVDRLILGCPADSYTYRLSLVEKLDKEIEEEELENIAGGLRGAVGDDDLDSLAFARRT
jgi:hypothetical protein